MAGSFFDRLSLFIFELLCYTEGKSHAQRGTDYDNNLPDPARGAEGNVFRRIHGQYDSCVTPNGHRQIAALAQRFAGIPVDAVYASDLKRTCLTATAIYRQKSLPLHRDARFREVGLGPWEDTPFGELERRYPAQLHAFSHDSYHWYVEGAECFLQYAHRFLAGLDDVVRRHEGQSIAIFSHGMVLRAR